LLGFSSKKLRDDSAKNVIVCSDVEAASSVSAENGCSISTDKQKLRDSFTEEFQTSNQPPSSSALKCQQMTLHFV